MGGRFFIDPFQNKYGINFEKREEQAQGERTQKKTGWAEKRQSADDAQKYKQRMYLRVPFNETWSENIIYKSQH